MGCKKQNKAWKELFKAIITENDYYEGIKKWCKKKDISMDDAGQWFAEYYEDVSEASPYTWLDEIEDYLDNLSSEERKELEDIQDLVYAAY